MHANISIFVPHLGCPNMCSFCNQHHIACTATVPDENTIINAVNIAKSSKGYRKENTEIAFFGGSFTAIDRAVCEKLLKTAYEFVKNGTVESIRISTRPDAIDEEILDFLSKYGVKTIELGAQSMDDDVLAANDRGHTVSDVENAAKIIKSRGFVLGLQMMTGLHKDSEEKDILTARRLIDLKPNCVRIYPTITLKNTRLAELYNSGEYIPMSLDDSVRLCAEIKCMFEDAGISVIRTGLHTIDETAYIAGPWHPAFSEMCSAAVFRKKILSKLTDLGSYDILVNPKDVSKAIGQKKENINYFLSLGYNLKIVQDNRIKTNDVEVIKR